MLFTEKQIRSDRNPRHVAAYDLALRMKNGTLRVRQRDFFNKPQDFAFYRNLLSTVIRFWQKYHFLIQKLTGRKVEKLHQEVVLCLMLGLAQLEEELNVDEHAAVNETVKMIGAMKKNFLKGFVNANLRQFIRKKETLLAQLDKEPLDIQTSHEKWMVKRWIDFFGIEKTTQICEANNLPPQVNIVLNPKFDREETVRILRDLEYELTQTSEYSWVVENPGGLFDTEPAKKGAFLVQDRSFQKVAPLLRTIPKKRVLDACASPGGKLFHLEWLYGDGIETLVGIDISPGRVKRMEENKKRFQSKATLRQLDARLVPAKEEYDLIMVDAPCSATGTIRKHPEIKWDRKETDFLKNRELQLSILQGVAKNIASNGHLLYVTCSLEREENQSVIETFLSEQGECFEVVPFQKGQLEPKFLTEEGFYQVLPNREGMGAFAALLRKK